MIDKERIQKIVGGTVDNKSVHGSAISISHQNESINFAAGNLSSDSQFFIASTTKLFTSACIFNLEDNGQLTLDYPISKYLGEEILKNLHTVKNNDYSDQITLRHLLSQTSGLPDYFLGKDSTGKNLLEKLTGGTDTSWTFEEAIELSKSMPPKFAPGTKGKALYSDTNYQLLGKIIENLTSESVANTFEKQIIQPLELKKTYLYVNSGDSIPADIYFKDKPLKMPLTMSSFKADGGVVSTSEELMKFLKAFFEGKLFDSKRMDSLMDWNRIFFPLQYGTGISRFKLPRIFSPFKPFPEFIGHSGLSGAFAFYVPEKQVYLTGTVNQIHKPGTSFRLMVKLMNTIK